MNPDQPDFQLINLTPENIADYGVCGYKDIKKHLELRRKADWYKEYYPKGLRIKALISETGYQGMIEYVPGEYAHRPVGAANYMFIHCLFVGFKNEFKGKGFASGMIDEVIIESRQLGKDGVAVVTRGGSFMEKKDIFLKKGFEVIDLAKPDFELLVMKFHEDAPDPKFTVGETTGYPAGLTVLRSAQCPYSVKNVDAIMETARKMKLDVNLVELDAKGAQQAPNPFGTFGLVLDGKVISHHPISNTRFENIMKGK
jgi:hypothetical protein